MADELMFRGDHLSKATMPPPDKVRAVQAAMQPGGGGQALYSPQMSLTTD